MLKKTLPPLLLAVGLSAAAAHAEPVKSVGGEPAWAEKAQAPLAWRSPQFAKAAGTRQVYPAPALSRIAELQDANAKANGKRTQIGISRLASEAESPLADLRWQAVEGGAVARIDVQSKDAAGLRVGLRIRGADPRMELRFAGSDSPGEIQALVSGAQLKDQMDAQGLLWTPITDGDTQYIEVFVPEGVDVANMKLLVPVVSHLVTSMRSGFAIAPKIGESGSCNVDTACRVGALGQAFVNAKNSVAWMNFVDGGVTYICTGTLLNDTVAASQIPYFYTANHCIDSQSVANTLITIWNYESTSCGSGVSASVTQRTGGADLLASDPDSQASAGTDGALLRLRSAPPGGAFFAGWNANPLAQGADVLAIHHPSGDSKKASLGQHRASDSFLNEVGWLNGTTEGGSSGSGLFTLSSGSYELRGGLYGGQASCANSGSMGNANNWDVYSRLDVFFPDIQQYLAPAAQSFGPSNGRDYTGPWNVPTEAGWGLTMFQFDPPTNYLFALIFIYDDTGVAKWYEYSGSWTATDVSSGDVLESTAAPWGPTYNPANRAFTPAGTATLTFTSATTANITFTVEGVTRTAAIQMIQ